MVETRVPFRTIMYINGFLMCASLAFKKNLNIMDENEWSFSVNIVGTFKTTFLLDGCGNWKPISEIPG